MQIFLSTTFHGTSSTDLNEVLSMVNGMDVDGVELGSTHLYHPDILKIVKENWKKHKVTHNFFPAAKDSNFVMNIASSDPVIRKKSLSHAKYCIEFSADIGSSVYTIHPGFTAMANVNKVDKKTYDFNFMEEKVDRRVAFSHMVKSLDILVETAKKNGVKLAIETEGSLTKPGILLMERIEECNELFSIFTESLYLNFNLAHTRFASVEHGYDIADFIKSFYSKIALVEISHNNGKIDQHLPLIDNSYVFDYLPLLPNVPHILEFRNSTTDQINNSIRLMRRFSRGHANARH